MSTQQHRELAKDRKATCAVLTISDTRTTATDKGGRTIIDALTEAGHQVSAYEIVRDEPVQIEALLRSWVALNSFDLICTTGGTGISSRDTTIEVVERLLTKKLDGFGEIFRMLSYGEVGAAAMLSRAIGGLSGETLLFALPGSTNAVNLAMQKLIVPELSHLIWERTR